MCSHCGEIKPLDNFGNMKSSKDGKRNTCKDCRKQEYEANKDYYIKKQRIYFENNKEKVMANNDKYKKDNPKWYREYNRRYYQENKKRMKENSKRSLYRRMEEDKGFLILQRLRKRMYEAMKGRVKSKRTIELIGCSVDELHNHIEKQFVDGMNWDNYGKWHVDHIIPCASFDFTKKEDQIKCFNYKNLQPLWAEDNIRKGKKII